MTGCKKTPVSLQLPLGVVAGVVLVVGVVLEELLQSGTCVATGCCLSGLFLVGNVRLVELESGVDL